MISVEELIAEYERLEKIVPKESGYTRREFQEYLGCGKDKALRVLKALVDSGRIKTGKGYRESISGVRLQTPVYLVVEEQPKNEKASGRARRK